MILHTVDEHGILLVQLQKLIKTWDHTDDKLKNWWWIRKAHRVGAYRNDGPDFPLLYEQHRCEGISSTHRAANQREGSLAWRKKMCPTWRRASLASDKSWREIRTKTTSGEGMDATETRVGVIYLQAVRTVQRRSFELHVNFTGLRLTTAHCSTAQDKNN
jgi:hypothetical protein